MTIEGDTNGAGEMEGAVRQIDPKALRSVDVLRKMIASGKSVPSKASEK